MAKGKTVPRDGKGRTSKANNKPRQKTWKETILDIVKQRREKEESRREILDKFKKLRPVHKEKDDG